MRWARPAKPRRPDGRRRGRDPERPRDAVGGRGVLPVVRAAQARDRPQVDDRARARLAAIVEPAVDDVDSILEGTADGERQQVAPAGGAKLIEQRLAMGVVDADQRPVARLLVAQNAALGAQVAAHAAMPLEMVRAQVQDHRHAAAQLVGQLQLVGRQLQDIDVFALV